MPEGATGSTVPRRQLGRYLRDLRGQARLTIKGAAQALEWSETKMWRVEAGQTSTRSLDVKQMCDVYGAPPEATEFLMALAKETKARGWWLSYADIINEGFDVYIGLEEAAEHLSWYESELVPGLFQTEQYARCLIRDDNPGISDEEVDRRVQLRIERQVLLTRKTAPPQLNVVLNESIVRRVIGGEEVMADQLDRIIQLSDLPNVALKVMPFSAGLHPGIMSGPFVMLNFPVNGSGAQAEPPTIYVEGFTGRLFLDKPHEIQRYEGAWKRIWSKALSEKNTKTLIQQVAREVMP